MNLLPDNNWSIPQRQARAGLLVIFYKATITIVKALWPALIVLLFRQGKKGQGFLGVLLIVVPVLILLRSLIEFYYFRFYIENDELIIRKGLISKKTIAIPLAKIQAVHIEQSLVHQLIRVVKVKIDTAGSEKTEATIDALAVEKAEQFKSFLLQEKQELTGDTHAVLTASETPVIRLSPGDVFKLGISANHIQTFFIVLAFAFSFINNLEEAFGDKILKTVRDSSSAIGQSMTAIALLVAFVLGLSVIVSMARIVLRYFDFTLSETPQGFKLKTGLINTSQNLVPFSKIQFISWEANWIRRKIGLYNLEFHQVTANEHETRKKQKVKIPVTQAAYIGKLLSHYHAQLEPVADSVHRIHPAYPFRRAFIVGILPVSLLLLVGWLFWWKLWMLAFVVPIPYIYLNALVYRRNFRLYVAPDALQVNSGIWGRETRIVQWYKIQQVTVKQSFYQRRKALATVELYTAGGMITIPWVTLELAQLIRNYALYEVERSPRPWM